MITYFIPILFSLFCNKADASVPQKRIIHQETVIVDTLINRTKIVYKIEDNNDVAGYPDREYIFADRTLLISLYSEGITNEFALTREHFYEYVFEDEKGITSINYCECLGSSGNGSFIFLVRLCIPDTDLDYSFILTINTPNQYKITPIEVESDVAF